MFNFVLAGGSEATFKGWMVIIAFVIIAVGVIYFVIPKINAAKFAKLPELKSPAKVAERRLLGQGTIHAVTFELSEGKKITFDLSEEQYNAFTEGSSGVLTYKETEDHKKDRFLSFEMEKKASEHGIYEYEISEHGAYGNEASEQETFDSGIYEQGSFERRYSDQAAYGHGAFERKASGQEEKPGSEAND